MMTMVSGALRRRLSTTMAITTPRLPAAMGKTILASVCR
jgi:hypothetical protein